MSIDRTGVYIQELCGIQRRYQRRILRQGEDLGCNAIGANLFTSKVYAGGLNNQYPWPIVNGAYKLDKIRPQFLNRMETLADMAKQYGQVLYLYAWQVPDERHFANGSLPQPNRTWHGVPCTWQDFSAWSSKAQGAHKYLYDQVRNRIGISAWVRWIDATEPQVGALGFPPNELTADFINWTPADKRFRMFSSIMDRDNPAHWGDQRLFGISIKSNGFSTGWPAGLNGKIIVDTDTGGVSVPPPAMKKWPVKGRAPRGYVGLPLANSPGQAAQFYTDQMQGHTAEAFLCFATMMWRMQRWAFLGDTEGVISLKTQPYRRILTEMAAARC